jgi:rubrerythrin
VNNLVELYRCRVCADPYIGDSKPSRCPFCGAYECFIVPSFEYSETFDMKLDDKNRENVEKALQIEISNAEFYFCASNKAEDDDSKNLFKALAKVESEHASIWRKVLKIDKIEISKSENECSLNRVDNLKESHNREDKAIKFYKSAAQDAKNSGLMRLHMLFYAIVQVEEDHLKLSEVRLN